MGTHLRDCFSHSWREVGGGKGNHDRRGRADANLRAHLRLAYRDLGGVESEQERDPGTGPDGLPRLATFSPQ
jgi:hypothetical protein